MALFTLPVQTQTNNPYLHLLNWDNNSFYDTWKKYMIIFDRVLYKKFPEDSRMYEILPDYKKEYLRFEEFVLAFVKTLDSGISTHLKTIDKLNNKKKAKWFDLGDCDAMSYLESEGKPVIMHELDHAAIDAQKFIRQTRIRMLPKEAMQYINYYCIAASEVLSDLDRAIQNNNTQ